jgi:hypothetical protein
VARRSAWAEFVPPDRETPHGVPHFGVTAYGRESPCPHRGAYPAYSRLVCMQCYATGMVLGRQADGHRLPPQVDLDDGLGPLGKLPPGSPPPVVVTAAEIKARARRQRLGSTRKQVA